MKHSTADLVAMVGSRLCHDLISPVGAMQNGLELLAMSGGPGMSPEMSLIQESCNSAAARIQFFRVAFGAASADQKVSPKQASTTVSGYTGGSRLQADWKIDQPMTRDRVQLAYLAFLCCESALPSGGVIQISEDVGVLKISAVSSRVKADAEAWAFLRGAGDLETITPARVQFALISVLSEDRGYRLEGSVGEGGAQITLA